MTEGIYLRNLLEDTQKGKIPPGGRGPGWGVNDDGGSKGQQQGGAGRGDHSTAGWNSACPVLSFRSYSGMRDYLRINGREYSRNQEQREGSLCEIG